jgi:peptidyl-prolyl cis-trans isomerase B (cyclophilin B)
MTREQERARARRRQRKLDARAAHRQAESARTRQALWAAGAVLVVVALFVVLSTGLRDGGTEAAGRAAGATPSPTADPASAGCAPAPPVPGKAATMTLPDKASAAGKTFVATVTTNCGDITLELHGEKAPQTVASFVSLARGDYWRNAPCSRLTTGGIFVLQCGDPTGTGSGGPGYGFGIENAPADGAYPAGAVAMARTQDPDSNGGQFFIVHQDTALPTEGGGYSIFGTVTAGMDIVERIAAAGTAGGAPDGAPAVPISILDVAVTEKKA